MKIKMFAVALTLAGAVSVSGCATQQQQNGTLIGGALGAGTGALVGSAVSGGSVGGALAGAAIGGVGGALVGNAVTAPRHCARHGYDAYGNRVCVAYYN